MEAKQVNQPFHKRALVYFLTGMKNVFLSACIG